MNIFEEKQRGMKKKALSGNSCAGRGVGKKKIKREGKPSSAYSPTAKGEDARPLR